MKKKIYLGLMLIAMIKTATEENEKTEKNVEEVINNSFSLNSVFTITHIPCNNSPKMQGQSFPKTNEAKMVEKRNSAILNCTARHVIKQLPAERIMLTQSLTVSTVENKAFTEYHSTMFIYMNLWLSTVYDHIICYDVKRSPEMDWAKPQNRPWHVVKDKDVLHPPKCFDDLFRQKRALLSKKDFLSFCRLFEVKMDAIYTEIIADYKGEDFARVQGFHKRYITKRIFKDVFKGVFKVRVARDMTHKIHDLLVKMINPNKLTRAEWRQGLCSEKELYSLYCSPCGLPLPDYMLTADGRVVLTQSRFPYMK